MDFSIGDVSLWHMMVQGIGFVATVFSLGALVLHDDRKLKFTLGVAGAIWAVHYLLLGAFAACAMTLTTAVRNFTALRWRGLWVQGFFISLPALTAPLFVHSWADTLPVFSTIVVGFAIFNLRGFPLRLCLLAAALLWLAHDALNGSWGGVVTDFISACLNSVMAWRALMAIEPPYAPPMVGKAALLAGRQFRNKRRTTL